MYAIKKVTLSPSGHQRLRLGLQRMLREVRLLAAIQDVNVLRYYHSWIEFVYRQPEEQKTEEHEGGFLSPHIGFESPPHDLEANPTGPSVGCETPITEGTERQ